MDARHLATVLLIWLGAACAGTDRPTDPVVPPPPNPPPPANPPPPPPPPQQLERVGYFVAPDGSDEAAGTKDDPWSYEHAFAGAAGVIQPGDTVWFRVGTY